MAWNNTRRQFAVSVYSRGICMIVEGGLLFRQAITSVQGRGFQGHIGFRVWGKGLGSTA